MSGNISANENMLVLTADAEDAGCRLDSFIGYNTDEL